MSYIANQYNYATPHSSAAGLLSDPVVAVDKKYFVLSNNVLDGSFYPVSGDVGLWSNAISGADGTLSEPFVVTVTENLVVNAVRLVGSTYSYPVDFTVSLYDGDGALLETITETGNAAVEYVKYLPVTRTVARVVVSITKISSSNSVAMLYNMHSPAHIKRADELTIALQEISVAGELKLISSADRVPVATHEEHHVTNIIDVTTDTAKVNLSARSMLTNVHTKMKAPSRRIYGKVYITYTNPMLDSLINVDTNMSAYNSRDEQVVDGHKVNDEKLFMLYDNDLSGAYTVISDESQVGWVSGSISDSDGYFSEPPYLHIGLEPRPIVPISIYFDDSHGVTAMDFAVVFTHENGTSTTKSFVDNVLYRVPVNDEMLANVTAITVTVTRVSKPHSPVTLLEVPIASTILYEGVASHSDLMSIDLLEELTYDDDVEALGGVSANEVTIVLDNSDHAFYFNNTKSAVASQLRKNRKIEPWLGVEIVPGTIEWYKQGTFWSYSWNVPVGGIIARVVGFDTIGLLDTTAFSNHQVLQNTSIGELVEYVLQDAKSYLDFITWKIDPALYDVIIPYAWFENRSHTAALRRISQAYPMHIYCDKDGNICAAPQKLRLDYYYDTWSDSTNVISKEYNSLYTVLPNIVNVTVKIPQRVDATELVRDNLVFDVANVPTRTLNFSKPYISDIQVLVDADETVEYSYTTYSWGIAFTFTGTGTVRSIVCSGAAVDIANTSVITRRNEHSIRTDGAVTRDVSADFIQTSSLASTIINRIFALSENDKYDATVEYRGDIALSINDPILLLDGIAPDNRYNIRRHELTWNGALRGTVDLNT